MTTAELNTSFGLELTCPTNSTQLLSCRKARFFIMALLTKAGQTVFFVANSIASVTTRMDFSASFDEGFLLFLLIVTL